MLNHSNLVNYSNGQPTTNSLLVAEKFRKRHSDVIRSIENQISTNAKLRSLFLSTTYEDSKGEQRPMYIMNRDGFSLLVMGFTGKDALNFKLEFIEAFNVMEQRLKEQKPLTPAEMFLQNAQLMVEHDNRIAQVESKLHVLEAKTTTRPDYFTIAGYGTLHHISVNLKQASILGRRASKLCKERNLQTDKTPDPRYGEVKMYPREVLDEVFNEPIN
ncbi:MAG: Rha family transcriptional regulator [Candidatus Azobacteroides sp.]|nr:Rha family transcriptional regulator [Candidatus Azobacteroides sp.]